MPKETATRPNSDCATVTVISTPRGANKAFRLPVLVVSLGLALAGFASVSGQAESAELKIPANDPSFKSRIYAGIGFGASNLDPDTSGTVFTVDENGDNGTQVRIGADVHNMLAFEIESSVLGEAMLREAPAGVSYSSVSLSALVYGLNGVQLRSRREGWSAYGRLGFSRISRSSQVITLGEDLTGVVVGLGAEYGFDNGLGIRGELSRYADEVTFFGVNAVYRFGRTPRQIGELIAESARPVLDTENTYVEKGGRDVVVVPSERFESAGNQPDNSATARPGNLSTRNAGLASDATANRPTLAVASPSAISMDDSDGDGVSNAEDACLETGVGVSVGEDGCGLFDAVLGDITYEVGSSRLDARARAALDHIIPKLIGFPEVRVEVRAHTDSQGIADDNLALSLRRAEMVVRYMIARGVPEIQLQSRGAGESQPMVSNRTAEGRERNRRVELVTLANVDQAVLDGQQQVRSNVWHYPLTPEARNALRDVEDGTLEVKPEAPVTQRTSDEAQQPGAEQPELGAAFSTNADARTGAGRVPPIDGLRLTPLPPQGYVAGFDVTGVIHGLGFATGSDQISAAGRAAVARIKRAMDKHPSARIAIMAHTDNTGDRDKNLELSRQRANRVVDALVDAGIDAKRLTAEGFGDSLPLVQNVTDEDRARNRRIEVRLLR